MKCPWLVQGIVRCFATPDAARPHCLRDRGGVAAVGREVHALDVADDPGFGAGETHVDHRRAGWRGVPEAPADHLQLHRFDVASGLLDEGTQQRSALELAIAVEQLGGHLACGAGWNATVKVSGVDLPTSVPLPAAEAPPAGAQPAVLLEAA